MDMQKRVEAVLSVKDMGYTESMRKANKLLKTMGDSSIEASNKTETFKETLGGMAAAIGVTKLLGMAFDGVKKSIDSAFNRQDTMDNFSRSVYNMTKDAKAGEKALESLNSQARGTAYGLDIVAKATQGFITSGLEIEKSTRYIGGWMDAVSNYGNGTNEQLSNVTYQLSQMLAKGKANLGDLKSAMEAGIPVTRIYAEAVGESTEQVSKDISAGRISAEDFMDVMDKAFREGTTSFNGIQGAAKNAGATWRGTFDNMSAATTRGTLSIINAIEDARRQANLPTMKDSVVNFGKASERVLNSVATVAGFAAKHFEALAQTGLTVVAVGTSFKVWDVAKNKIWKTQETMEQARKVFEAWGVTKEKNISLSQLYDNMLKTEEGSILLVNTAKKMNIALTKESAEGKLEEIALTDAQKAKIVAETGAITLKGLAMGVLKGQISLTTAAQLAFNTALKANPIGVAIAGISALVGGFKLLKRALERTTPEFNQAQDTAKAYADQAKQVADSALDLSKGFEESTADIKANSREARELVNRLNEISTSSMSTKNKQAAMASTMEELRSKYPKLNIELDKTGTKIQSTTEYIDQQLDSMEEMAKMDAMKEYLKELYKDQYELEAAYHRIQGAMEDMVEQGTNVQRTWYGGFKESEGYAALREELEHVQEAMDKTASSVDYYSKELNVMTREQLEAKDKTEKHRAVVESLRGTYGKASEAIVSYADKTGKPLEEVTSKVEELSSKFGLSAEEVMHMTEVWGGSLEDFAAAHEENLKRAEDTLNSWVDSTATGFKEVEQKATISLDKYIETLRKNAEASRKWATNVKKLMSAGISEGIIKELEKLGPAGAMQAQAWVDELNELNGGTDIGLGQVNDTVKDKLKLIDGTFTDSLLAAGQSADVAIQASDYGGKGERMVAQMVTGIANRASGLDKEITITIKSGASTAKSEARIAGYDSAGRAIVDQLSGGMLGVKGRLNSAGRTLSAEARAGFGAVSAYGAGSNFALGFIRGMNSQVSQVKAAAGSLGYSAHNSMRRSLSIQSPSKKSFQSGIYYGLGFIKGFKDITPKVIDSVLDMSKGISDVQPMPDDFGFGSIPNLEPNKQAANINISMGGQVYRAFVDDITRQQNKQTQLQLSY